MGVYIPPPSDGASSGPPKGGSSNPNGSTLTLPNPSRYIPHNPSMGLKVFGPLVPSADNVFGLYVLTALQFAIGTLGFNKARTLRASRLRQLNIPNTFQHRLTKYSCFLGGSYLSFQSGLELTRLMLPYDPWNDEAKFYRQMAIKNGERPNWWFGAFHYYDPMSFQEWNRRVESWIVDAESKLEGVDGTQMARFEHMNRQSAALFSKLANKGRYAEIYKDLSTTNQRHYQDLLENDLAGVHSLNKAERIDAILEDKSPIKYNEHYPKPPIQLRNYTLATDDDLDMAWVNLNPWEELQQELLLEIRLIPGCETPKE